MELFNLLFMQVQNLVVVVQGIQATPTLPQATQPLLVVPHVAS